MELDGRTAVVTGAASGIGLALTERFLTEGMRVVMADVEQPALEREAARITGAGGAVTPVVCDVSDADQVAGLRDATLAAYGSVQLLCNNAGVASGQPNHRTPTGVPSNSRASDSDSPTTPYLVAWYAPRTGDEVSPASEAVLTTWPSPCSSMRGTNVRTP